MAKTCLVCGAADGTCHHDSLPTGPRYPVIEWRRKEPAPMAAHDDDFIYVDIEGNEVSQDDPAVQTRYTRRDFKALDKAVVFGAAPVGHAAKAADAEEREVLDAKSADPSAAAGDDETADTPAAAASVKHGKR